MTSASETVVKCPSCGKFVARISGADACVTMNHRCGNELSITCRSGEVAVAVVGKSAKYFQKSR